MSCCPRPRLRLASMHCLAVIRPQRAMRAHAHSTPGRNVELDEFATSTGCVQPGRVALRTPEFRASQGIQRGPRAPYSRPAANYFPPPPTVVFTIQAVLRHAAF